MVKIPDPLVTENTPKTFCNSLWTNPRAQPVMHHSPRMELSWKCIEGFLPVYRTPIFQKSYGLGLQNKILIGILRSRVVIPKPFLHM
uniref:Uncharacterized protein n=1 Tax=Lotus japonicus TaxID=34305 RepID=I3T2D6_LOTJA|nr:unknown [Lotus japonicus]